MKICVLIPSHNESRTIGSVVKEIKEMDIEVIVIDDGSSDDTERIAAESGAVVMRHVRNLGKGASLNEGFKFITKATNFDTIVIMDGDGQHSPKDIKRFIKHAEENNDDIVIGNRMDLTKDMPFVRLATNKFMSSLLSVLCKQRIPDTQCGFKLIRRSVLEKIQLETTKYDFESELIIEASRKRLKIASVPIETIYRDELSGIHPVRDTMRFISLLIRAYLRN